MPRDNINDGTVTIRLPKAALTWFKDHARRRGMKLSEVFRRALGEYARKEIKQDEQ